MTLIIITLLLTAAQLAIKAALIAALLQFVSLILYAIEGRICAFIDLLAELFNMVVGVTPVSYDGKESIFLNVFFSNDTIATIYWGMALIGIAMAIGFAIFAVIKKMFDGNDKYQVTFGTIFGGLLKAILLIVGMNAIMSMAIMGSNVLLNQMDYLWTNAHNISFEYTVYFDEEDYAAMARVYNTIAQYSLNPTYNSRYNLNSCFNAIRKDLKEIQDKDKFKYTIKTTDAYGNEIETWQSVLQRIVTSEDLSQDVDIDTYSEARNDAILHAMEVLRSDTSTFKPILSYTVKKQSTSTVANYDLGRLIMLTGSLNCAYNSYYNQNPSFDDGLRGKYLRNEGWDIYKTTDADNSFNLSIFDWDHIFVIVFAWMFLKQYIAMIFNAAGRMLNLILLYLLSPPLIAATPLDNGKKVQQWTKSFIIQMFTIFGVTLSMRLFNMMMPVLISSDLVFFPDAKDNLWAKMIILLALAFTVKKAGGMITGILADNAGMAAITAGDMSSEAGAAADTAKRYMMKAVKAVGGAALGQFTKNAKKMDAAKGKGQAPKDVKSGLKQGLKESWGGLKP